MSAMTRPGTTLPEQHTRIVVLRSSEGAFDPQAIGRIKERLDKASNKNCELLFNSEDFSVIGLVVRTNKPVGHLRNTLDEGLNFKNHGFVLILSPTDEWTGIGNGSGTRHLQRFLSIT